MKATTFLVAATLLTVGLLALPFDNAPTGTAAAVMCTLDDGVRAYVECERNRCEEPTLKDPVVMCYD